MKSFFSILLCLLTVNVVFAESKTSTIFTPCNDYQESLKEHYNLCVGLKCENIWVYIADASDMTQQSDDRITNLNEFEVEFRARVAFAAVMGQRITKTTYKTTYETTILGDPFNAISFKKKVFCQNFKGSSKFIGSLKTLAN
jgi:hypothetical protein